MIKVQEDIVCVSFPSWDGNYVKATVQLMIELAKHNRVLFVDYEYTLKDVLMALVGKQHAPVKRMMGIHDRLREVELKHGGKIYILNPPPVIPINWVNNPALYRDLLYFNASIIEKSIKQAMQRLGMHHPVVFNAFNPYYGVPLAGKFNEKMLIYYCYDEIRHARWCKKHGGRMEDEFLKLVDLVITTSPALLNERSKKHRHCFLVPNGVDFKLFHQALKIKQSRNRGNSRKVIGYIGTIDDRLDYFLLESVIRELPAFDFHFIGRITCSRGIRELKRFPNVHIFGPVEPSALPPFLAAMDAAMIPFVKNGFTQNIYPLKVNEYLAAGLPVVTTNFGNLHDMEGIIDIVDSTSDFINALVRATEENSPELTARRIKMAESNTWEARAAHVGIIINLMKNESKRVYVQD